MSKRKQSALERAARALTPRNPLVVPALGRKAGPHEKRRGALRRAERMALQRAAEGVPARRCPAA